MAPVINLAGRSAAPANPPGARPGTPDPIQLYADAHNALAMALHYLRQPQANVPGAARKAVQALAALRSLGSGRDEPAIASAVPLPAAAALPAQAAHLSTFAAWLTARQGRALQAMRERESDSFGDHCETFTDMACSLRALGQFEREQHRDRGCNAIDGGTGA